MKTDTADTVTLPEQRVPITAELLQNFSFVSYLETLSFMELRGGMYSQKWYRPTEGGLS
jgi:hypothetical protein